MVAKEKKPAFLDELHEEFDIKRDWDSAESVSTGILALDHATTRGGMPRGVVVDLYGDEGLGKTTMCLTMAAERIRKGERVVYVDVEHRLQPELIDMVIPNRDLFEVFEPKTGEGALTIVETCLHHPQVKMVVLDSVAALSFKEEEEIGKYMSPMALLARKMSLFTKKLLPQVYELGTFVVLINQTRIKISTWGPTMKDTTGGKAVKFYSSLRVGLSLVEFLKKTDAPPTGQRLRLKTEKNSFGPSHREGEVSVVYGQGVDRMTDMIECGVELGVIIRSGGYLRYKQVDDKGEVVLEIQGHGEADFGEKALPHLESMRDFIRKVIGDKAKKEIEDRKVAREKGITG